MNHQVRMNSKIMLNNWTYIRQLFLRFGILFLIYSLLRVVFFFFNREVYEGATVTEILQCLIYGWRYDLSALVYTNSLFIILHAAPHPFRGRNGYQSFLKGLFFLVNGFAIAIAVADLVYFQFNKKRISTDLLSMMQSFGGQGLQFFVQYWYLFALFVLVMLVMNRLYLLTGKATGKNDNPAYLKESALFLFCIGLSILAARGGFGNLPLTPAQAAKAVDPRLASIVTNSPHTFLYSLQKRKLEERNYMSMEEAESIIEYWKHYPQVESARKKNVIVLVLESFSREYIGSLNDYPGYTPFLDSLSGHCLVFSNAFASAERSNKALPAIIAGVPSLMDDPIMYSAYQDNCLMGLGKYLRNEGYHTSFFHGGINGEFNLDALAPAAGFDYYYGKDEFNDDRFFDGHWGIFDEEFLQYFAGKLDDFPQPFCSVLFTVSSHHPFPIPVRYKGKFPKEELEISESIAYTDYSLRRFFEKALASPWFNNTVFVITADHTFQYGERKSARYENRAGYFSVPLCFYTSDGSLNGVYQSVVQHTDIIPSLLDYLGYDKPFGSFGSSAFRDSTNRTAIQYLDHLYQIEDDRYCLLFDGQKAIGLYLYLEDPYFKNNLLDREKSIAEKLTRTLEAYLQLYTSALRENKLCLQSGRV